MTAIIEQVQAAYAYAVASPAAPVVGWLTAVVLPCCVHGLWTWLFRGHKADADAARRRLKQQRVIPRQLAKPGPALAKADPRRTGEVGTIEGFTIRDYKRGDPIHVTGSVFPGQLYPTPPPAGLSTSVRRSDIVPPWSLLPVSVNDVASAEFCAAAAKDIQRRMDDEIVKALMLPPSIVTGYTKTATEAAMEYEEAKRRRTAEDRRRQQELRGVAYVSPLNDILALLKAEFNLDRLEFMPDEQTFRHRFHADIHHGNGTIGFGFSVDDRDIRGDQRELYQLIRENVLNGIESTMRQIAQQHGLKPGDTRHG